nr:hypothetical protein [Lachnospiraceae bacterium]
DDVMKTGEIDSLDVSGSILLSVTRYYLPDMLWGYALVFALYGCMDEKDIRIPFVISLFFSAVVEGLQLLPFIPGRFDIVDIVAEVIAETAAVYIIKIKMEGEVCLKKEIL